jgi:HNH endonuclease
VYVYHIKHWADGSETSPDNLVTLCRYHQRQLYQGSFSIAVERTAGESQLAFSTLSGGRIETSMFPQFQNVSTETSTAVLRDVAPR